MTGLIGIDIGGTFTDFVLIEDGQVRILKRLTSTADPAQSFLEGIVELGLSVNADVVHGSTIATNALLERKGARTALVTTAGFADVIEIGRQNRPDLYALVPEKPDPLVPRDLRFEVAERVLADGTILKALNSQSVSALRESLRAAEVESVAVVLLYSFLYRDHEQLIADALRDEFFISLSSEILPEYREYERTSTTVINAYVMPLIDRYLTRVEAGLNGRRLRIMQSNGGVISARTARQEAGRTALSGPAGGAVGAFEVAKQAGLHKVITFDMGGTSTDVALLPGMIPHTKESTIGGLPLRLPVVDIHTVGAGGGSLARVDSGGALRVGPQSAGANPGPACYGKGDQPTVTDANLIIGRLRPDHFLGGQMPLDVERALEAITTLAGKMGITPHEAASGVIQVANAAMNRAIRAISVERGYDPREFALVAFGGAGPLHACDLADTLRIPRVLIPSVPGVLSALGMTLADITKDYAQTVLSDEKVLDPARLDTIFRPLETQGQNDILNEGVPADQIELQRALDIRYKGQSHEITVAEPVDGDWVAAFDTAHESRYSYRQTDTSLVIVTARLTAIGRTDKAEFTRLPLGDEDAADAVLGSCEIGFGPGGPVTGQLYTRDKLRAGNKLSGPALIVQFDTTTVIPPGWKAQVDPWGNLIILNVRGNV